MHNDYCKLYSVQPKYIFGFSVGPSNNCFFLNEENIVYYVSGVIVVHDIMNRTQKYVHLIDPQKTITAMDLNNGKNYIALAEKGKRPSVNIYNLVTLKHTLRLTIPYEINSDSFIRIKFTHDDAYLALLTGHPNFTMYYYHLRTLKVESHVQIVYPPNTVGPVNEMALNPFDVKQICFVGKGLFSLMEFGEVVWKQTGFHNASKLEFTTACWLKRNRILAGTSKGQLALIEDGELKSMYNVQTLTHFDLNQSVTNPLNVRPLLDGQNWEIRCCKVVTNGFMLVVGGYRVCYYEKKEALRYKLTTVLIMTRDKCLEQIENRKYNELHMINTLAISPKKWRIMCVTSRSQLYTAVIGENIGMMEVPIEPFENVLHHGGVSGLSVCRWKPVFMTCSMSDRTVKLWNYVTRSLLLSRHYPDDDVVDVSLHPTGVYSLLSFATRVEFAAILDERLETRRTFKAIDCRQARFSWSGHVFAVVNEFCVDVYCSITFQIRFVLSGHDVPLTNVMWATDNWKLYLCDVKGRICQYNLFTSKHIVDDEHPDRILSGIAVSNDSKQVFTVSKDGYYREVYGKVVICSRNLESGPLNAIQLSTTNTILFVACQSGAVLSLKLPMKSPAEYKKYHIHRNDITQMQMTVDKAILITCSADDSICIWNVTRSNGTILDPSTAMPEVLVPMMFLQRKFDTVTELKAKLAELTKKNNSDVAEITEFFESQLRELNDHHSKDMKPLEKEKQEMLASFEIEKTNLENKIDTMKKEHELTWKMLIDSYENKLKNEDIKYKELTDEVCSTKAIMNKEEDMKIKVYEREVYELTEKFNDDMKKRENDFQNFKVELNEEIKHSAVEMDEFENMGDRELLELKTVFLVKCIKLTRLQKKILKEVNAFKAKVKMAQKEEIDIVFLYEKYENDIIKMRTMLKTLDENITEMEGKMITCNEIKNKKDSEIKAKTIRITSLKKDIIQLRCVVKEQENVKNPLVKRLIFKNDIQREMKCLKNGINSEISKIQLSLVNWQQKITSISKQLKESQRINNNLTAFITNTRIDLHFICMEFANETVFNNRIRSLHVSCLNFSNNHNVHMDMIQQRQFQERYLANLIIRKAMNDEKKPSHVKLLENNRLLLESLNRQRKKMGINRRKYDDLVCELERTKRRMSFKVSLSMDAEKTDTEDETPSEDEAIIT